MSVTKRRVTKCNSPSTELPVRRVQTLTQLLEFMLRFKILRIKCCAHAKHSNASVKNKSTLSIALCKRQRSKQRLLSEYFHQSDNHFAARLPEPLKKSVISCTRVERCPKDTSTLRNRFAGQQSQGMWTSENLETGTLKFQSVLTELSRNLISALSDWEQLIFKAGRWSW